MENNPNMAYGTAVPSAPPRQTGQAGMDLQKLQAALNKFEISIAEANDLVVLQDYRIVVIADDSGSMQCPAEPNGQRRLGQPTKSRWDELQETLAALVEIASCVNPHGINMHFLNRQPIGNIRSAVDSKFNQAFSTPPAGGTPLGQTLNRIVQSLDRESPTLLFIFTDGEPSDGKSNFTGVLRQVVKDFKCRVQIMACTDDDEVMNWLNSVDRQFHEIDVTDDYYSERVEVLQNGLAPRFTRGDWVMKALLGPVSRKYDAWDENLKGRRKGVECELCTIS